MKTKIFGTLLFSFFLSLSQALWAAASPVHPQNDPDVKVVVSQKRIWLVTDEISVKSLSVQVKNEQGKVVMEKQFSSKSTDWSLNIESLPNGKYSVEVGNEQSTRFSR